MSKKILTLDDLVMQIQYLSPSDMHEDRILYQYLENTENNTPVYVQNSIVSVLADWGHHVLANELADNLMVLCSYRIEPRFSLIEGALISAGQ